MIHSFRAASVTFMGVMAVSACTSIPLTSLPKLAGLDAMTLDPADIEVAVGFQDGLALNDEAVMLEFEFTNGVSGERLGGSFPLEPLPGALTPFLAKKATNGQSILRFGLTNEQAGVIRAARSEAKTWPKQPDQQHSLSFSAEAKPCLTKDGNPFRAHRFSVYLRSDPDEEFFTMVKNKRLKLNDDGTGLQPCDETPS